MNVHARMLACLAVSIAIPTTAQAAVTVLTANLSGANEVPVVTTPGTGSVTASFDDATNILSVQATFSGLIGNTTMAHIHCCTLPGSNAGVATTVPSAPGFPLGVMSGSYQNVFDLTLASSFNPAFITNNGGTIASARSVFVNGLLTGRTYFNIHTTSFPGGEIRGNLAAVPEPATWAMMIGGFGMVGGAMRSARRRQKATFATM